MLSLDILRKTASTSSSLAIPFALCYVIPRASLVAQRVKHLPAMRETWVRSLGQEDPLEKEMATHSSTLAWKIPWTEKPGRLQSMGLQRVRHDGATGRTHLCRRQKRCRFDPWVGNIPGRRKWQSTPVFLPGESQRQRSQAGYSPWGCKESDVSWRLDYNVLHTSFLITYLLARDSKLYKTGNFFSPTFIHRQLFNLRACYGLSCVPSKSLLPLEPQNVTVFEGRTFKEVIPLKQGHWGGALIHSDWYPCKKRKFRYRKRLSPPAVWPGS